MLETDINFVLWNSVEFMIMYLCSTQNSCKFRCCYSSTATVHLNTPTNTPNFNSARCVLVVTTTKFVLSLNASYFVPKTIASFVCQCNSSEFTSIHSMLPTGALAFRNSHFGAGSGPVHLDGVDCSGHESNLFECPRNSFVSCSTNLYPGVRCQGKALWSTYKPHSTL